MAPTKPDLSKVHELLKMFDDSMSRDDFLKYVSRVEFLESFKAIIKHLASLEKRMLEKVDNSVAESTQELLSKSDGMFKESQSGLVALREEAKAALDKTFKESLENMNYVRDTMRRGIQGKNGQDGPPGPTGKDGSPDTPAQIRDKLEILEGDDRIDKSAIKGLDELEKRINTSGGGTSQIGVQFALAKMMKHQKWSTSSATTTITLNDSVAGGVCIWLRYQGQMLHYGDQYTISNKTITFTFTLDDSTIVEATYIRG